MKKFSVIIPVFNEEINIKSSVKNIQSLDENIEIILVDGESKDNSYKIAKSLDIEAYRSLKGRGIQLNTGAKKASGEILVFMHIDTKLPEDAFEKLTSAFKDENIKVCKFRMKFDSDHWILKFYSYFTQFDSLLTSFGDQVIAVRKDFFHSIGGFPNWPLFEDVHFFRVARKNTRIKSLPGPVITSARGFLKRGLIKQQIFNGFLIIKYLFGVSPKKLYEEYYNGKITKNSNANSFGKSYDDVNKYNKCLS
jgi:rSAM/selenodomain-associated transferase 2